ncbi:MAG: four helix bundle protein, partial [Pseudomonadota bacterium]
MRKHQELRAWQQSMDLVELVYRETRAFPDDERYGLISQMRRSAVSVPSNIAEGAGRGSNKDF